jgi:cytochrome c-type biogenesis protein CcmH
MKAAQEMSPEDRQAMIRTMVQRLADRLEENPNDKQGWTRLARAYDVLGEKEKAKKARERAAATK